MMVMPGGKTHGQSRLMEKVGGREAALVFLRQGAGVAGLCSSSSHLHFSLLSLLPWGLSKVQ